MLHFLFAILIVQSTYLDLYHDGHRLLNEGNVTKAETLLIESASLNPEHIPTLKALGEVYTMEKRFPEAIEQYRKVVAINEKDIEAWGHLAEIYSWVGEHDKSIVTYRDALKLAPEHLGLMTGLARVLRWSHRYDEAEKLYKETLATDPTSHEALKGLAKTYSLMGNLTDAILNLEQGIALYPDDAELHKELGTVLAWEKEFQKAITALQMAVDLSPRYVEAYRTMGDVYTWMKSHKEAAGAYKSAADLEPDNIENYLQLAQAYRTMGQNRMAEESLKSALRIDPENTRALDLMQEVRGDKGFPTIDTLRELVELSIFVFIFVIVFITYRSKRRLLRRRHRLYTWFTNLILPLLLVFTLVSYFGSGYFSTWMDPKLIEDITEASLFLALGLSFLALLWTEQRSKEFSEMVILAIGAHPDDIELGCGGFLLKARDSGARVYGLTFTKGEQGEGGNGTREEELRRAADYMAMEEFWLYDFRDTGLTKSVPEMRKLIEEKIREVKATTVLTHTHIDIHSDHQSVFEATREAARHCSVLCYEDVSTPREFVANYFVDISGYIEDKLKLISFHKSHERDSYMDPEVIKGRAAHRGLQCGLSYAEAFSIYKLLN
jgi:LmbE family N-acetylglucosaminyl deacetylase/cytochrome c-type biogenesis protein CcmH/NrfG